MGGVFYPKSTFWSILPKHLLRQDRLKWAWVWQSVVDGMSTQTQPHFHFEKPMLLCILALDRTRVSYSRWWCFLDDHTSRHICLKRWGLSSQIALSVPAWSSVEKVYCWAHVTKVWNCSRSHEDFGALRSSADSSSLMILERFIKFLVRNTGMSENMIMSNIFRARPSRVSSA